MAFLDITSWTPSSIVYAFFVDARDITELKNLKWV